MDRLRFTSKVDVGTNYSVIGNYMGDKMRNKELSQKIRWSIKRAHRVKKSMLHWSVRY